MFQGWNAAAPGKWASEWINDCIGEWCASGSAWGGKYSRDLPWWHQGHSLISQLWVSLVQPHSQAASPYRGKMVFRSSWLASSPSHSRARKRVSFTRDCIKITGSNRVTYPLLSQSLGPGKYHCSDWPARLGGWMGSTLNWEQRGAAPVEKQTRHSVLPYG